jgi:putative nucleotidyltransferase with HDIG domain
MSFKARLYLQLTTLAAALLLAAALFVGPPLFQDLSEQLVGVAWCIGIGLLAELMTVDFKAGLPGKQIHSSLAFLPFLSALIILSLSTAVGVIVLVCVFSNAVRRIEPLKALFNVSQAALAGFSAGYLYHAIVGGASLEFPYASHIAGFVILASTFFVVNMLLSSVALALLRDITLRDVVRQVMGTGGGNLLYDLLASPIAAVAAILYHVSPVTGMGLILLPLLLIHRSYSAVQLVIERNRDLLRALVKAIETRDPYTSGHSVRVQTLAKAIAQDLGLRRNELDQVETAALLHDIGKIHPEFVSVLGKPFALTPEERALIETHAVKGADLLREMQSVPAAVVLSVRHHHEHYDGSGYPDGLSGSAIPLPARIIMLCDSIDAMLSDRPYRKALSIPQVYSEIQRCSGTQFDPAVVARVLEKQTIQRAAELIQADVANTSWEHATWT